MAVETLSSPGPLLGEPPPRVKTWALHVGGSFTETPQDIYHPFIENVFHNRVMSSLGCSSPSTFCGPNPIFRGLMAVAPAEGPFTERTSFRPPATGRGLRRRACGLVRSRRGSRSWRASGVTGRLRRARRRPALPSYCPTDRRQPAADGGLSSQNPLWKRVHRRRLQRHFRRRAVHEPVRALHRVTWTSSKSPPAARLRRGSSARRRRRSAGRSPSSSSRLSGCSLYGPG